MRANMGDGLTQRIAILAAMQALPAGTGLSARQAGIIMGFADLEEASHRGSNALRWLEKRGYVAAVKYGRYVLTPDGDWWLNMQLGNEERYMDPQLFTPEQIMKALGFRCGNLRVVGFGTPGQAMVEIRNGVKYE